MRASVIFSFICPTSSSPVISTLIGRSDEMKRCPAPENKPAQTLPGVLAERAGDDVSNLAHDHSIRLTRWKRQPNG
jgi:hypothetical protein